MEFLNHLALGFGVALTPSNEPWWEGLTPEPPAAEEGETDAIAS